MVEDDKFLNKVYEIKLKEGGYETIIMEDGIGVEEKVKKEKPDVVVLDLMMPERDGFEVLRGLKADEETKNIPVIVLTVLKSDDDRKTVLESGAVDYVEKDLVSINEVVALIRKYSEK